MLLRTLFALNSNYTVCSVVALFAQQLGYLLGTLLYCLLHMCIVCSTFLLFAPQVYCLLNISTVCSTGVLFAQHFCCLLHRCIVCSTFLHTVCSTGLFFAQHFYTLFAPQEYCLLNISTYCLRHRCIICSTFLLFAPQLL